MSTPSPMSIATARRLVCRRLGVDVNLKVANNLPGGRIEWTSGDIAATPDLAGAFAAFAVSINVKVSFNPDPGPDADVVADAVTIRLGYSLKSGGQNAMDITLWRLRESDEIVDRAEVENLVRARAR